MRARALTLLLCFFVVTPLIVLARQQAVPAGAIRGIVRDSSGAPLPGAVVDVLQDGGFIRRAVAREDGSFAITGLKPGAYTIVAMLAGFSLEQRTVTLPAGSGLHQIFELSIGGVSEAVRVGD